MVHKTQVVHKSGNGYERQRTRRMICSRGGYVRSEAITVALESGFSHVATKPTERHAETDECSGKSYSFPTKLDKVHGSD